MVLKRVKLMDCAGDDNNFDSLLPLPTGVPIARLM